MAFKLMVAIILVAACMASLPAQAVTTRQRDENVAALFVKDANSGQLRFLGNRFSNSQINQLITNKQDFLEQFRPAAASNNNNNNWNVNVITATDIATDINTPIDTNTAPSAFTGTGTGIATDTNGIRPIFISAGNSKRPRTPSRRPGNSRRRGNKKPQVFVIRPGA